MSKIYSMAEDGIQAMVQCAIEKWHPELKEAGAKVVAIMVETHDGSPALSHGGFPSLAQAHPVHEKDKVTNAFDAEIRIDYYAFAALSTEKKIAVIDHELAHLKPRKKQNQIQRDDKGRPKIGTIKGDWNIGDGFREVVERHGENAVELENAKRGYIHAKQIADSLQ